MRLYKLFGIPLIGKRIILKYAIKKENGEMQSHSLREYYFETYKMEVGCYSYGCFSPNFNYATGGSVRIGRYCSFGSGVSFFGANHPMERFSTSPIFYRDIFGYEVKDVPRYELLIGNDVWCGYGVLITCGCRTIGNGAVIAAGAVVTKDVPPYAIVAGNPARVIRYRFNAETIEMLEKSKWYSLEPEEIMSYYKYADEPIEFAKAILDSKEI